MVSKSTLQAFALLRHVNPIPDREVVALYQSLAMRREMRATWLAVMRNLHGAVEDVPLDPELESFQKFVQHDVLGALAAEESSFDDLAANHPGAGRSIYALSLLAHHGAIRKDQARALLKEVLLPQSFGMDLEEIIQKSSALDEDDSDALEQIARQALEQNPKAAQEYLAGKQKALGALMGQVRRHIKADPRLVEETLLRLLAQA